MDRVETGKYYKNLPSGRICRVTGKYFYTVKYDDVDDVFNLNPHYCHYKTFKKNWIEVPDPNEV